MIVRNITFSVFPTGLLPVLLDKHGFSYHFADDELQMVL